MNVKSLEHLPSEVRIAVAGMMMLAPDGGGIEVSQATLMRSCVIQSGGDEEKGAELYELVITYLDSDNAMGGEEPVQ